MSKIFYMGKGGIGEEKIECLPLKFDELKPGLIVVCDMPEDFRKRAASPTLLKIPHPVFLTVSAVGSHGATLWGGKGELTIMAPWIDGGPDERCADELYDAAKWFEWHEAWRRDREDSLKREAARLRHDFELLKGILERQPRATSAKQDEQLEKIGVR